MRNRLLAGARFSRGEQCWSVDRPPQLGLLHDVSFETNSKQGPLPKLADVSARNAVHHLKYIC